MDDEEEIELPQELKNLKILIASTQWPYYGGSATNAYQLIKYLRKLGYNVAGVYFNDQNLGDIDQIGGVFIGSGSKQGIISYLGGWPDIIFGKNYAAPIVANRMFPQSKPVYLLSGSVHLATLANKGMPAKNYLDCPIKNKVDRKVLKKEIEALNKCIFIVPNSPFVEKIFRFIYQYWDKKITNWINLTAISYELSKLNNKIEKEYDVIFVATNFKRRLKNVEFVKRLFKHPKIEDKKKLVMGINSEIFNNEDIQNLRVIKNKHPDKPLSHYMILNMLSKTKVLIIPSLWDSNPNVVYEALANDAHVLISDCVGIKELFDDQFIAETNNLREWAEKLDNLIENHKKIELPKIFDQDELDNQIHSFIRKVLETKN